MKKIDKVKNRLKAIDLRHDELAALMKPFQDKMEPFAKENGELWAEKRKLAEELDELAFEPSLQYILSTTYEKFHYNSNNHNGSYNRMQKFIRDNYKYLKISGYNPKTNIYALEIAISTGADVKEVAKELSPAIKLALKNGQEHFGLFTDDLSESGSLSLIIKDDKYTIGKTRHGSYRVVKSCATLLEAVGFCLENKLTYTN